MGYVSSEIELWQKELNAPTGEVLEALLEVQQACLNLILTVEREISGIRDGNGRWNGGYPVDAQYIQEALDRLVEARRRETMPVEELLATLTPTDQKIAQARYVAAVEDREVHADTQQPVTLRECILSVIEDRQEEMPF